MCIFTSYEKKTSFDDLQTMKWAQHSKRIALYNMDETDSILSNFHYYVVNMPRLFLHLTILTKRIEIGMCTRQKKNLYTILFLF